MTYAIGVDLGGTKVDIGLVSTEGAIVERKRLLTDVSGGSEAILLQIVTSIEAITANQEAKPIAIGVGLPGQVASDRGVVHFAPNLQWKEVPFKAMLEASLNLPVFITNDVRAASFGEWQTGAGKGENDLVTLFIGTGIGGGIITNSHLISGAQNCAGEIGHMVIKMGGRPCTCGKTGCFEAYAGGWAIAQIAKEHAQREPNRAKCLIDRVGGDITKITAREVITCFHNGDSLAKELIQSVFDALVIGSVNVVNTLNPKRLIFGGGIMTGLSKILPQLAAGIKENALKSAADGLEVVLAGLGSDAGVIGAALYSIATTK